LSRDAIIDVGALRNMLVMVENTIDDLKGVLEGSKSDFEKRTGLVLPK